MIVLNRTVDRFLYPKCPPVHTHIRCKNQLLSPKFFGILDNPKTNDHKFRIPYCKMNINPIHLENEKLYY